MTEVRVHLLVSGRVQGVWYRKTVLDGVAALSLTGFVRNLSDGRVEIVAEGDRGSLEQLVALARKGSSMSSVEEVVLSWENALGDLGPFSIQR
jgi:acylphosphatase